MPSDYHWLIFLWFDLSVHKFFFFFFRVTTYSFSIFFQTVSFWYQTRIKISSFLFCWDNLQNIICLSFYVYTLRYFCPFETAWFFTRSNICFLGICSSSIPKGWYHPYIYLCFFFLLFFHLLKQCLLVFFSCMIFFKFIFLQKKTLKLKRL